MVGGVAGAIAAVPLGFLADKYSKIVMLRIGAVLSMAHAIITAAAIVSRLAVLFYLSSILSLVKLSFITGPQIAIIMLSASPINVLSVLIFVTGVLQPLAISSGPLAEMITDAIVGKGGNMSEETQVILMLAACAASLVAPFFLFIVSDQGYYREASPSSPPGIAIARAGVLSAGTRASDEEARHRRRSSQGLASIGALLLDKEGPSGESSEQARKNEGNTFELKGGGGEKGGPSDAYSNFNDDGRDATDDKAALLVADGATSSSTLAPSSSDLPAPARVSQRLLYTPVRLFGLIPLIPQSIPYLIWANDLAEGFGSGLTDSFFITMLSDYYGVSQMAGLAVTLASGLTSALLSILCVTASIPLGRALTVAIADVITLLCMVSFAFEPPLWLAITNYLFISGLSAGTMGVQRAMLADVVRPSSLSLWNSLENVSDFLASLGTYVAGRNIKRVGKPWGYFLNAKIAIGLNLASLLFSALVVPMARDRNLTPKGAGVH